MNRLPALLMVGLLFAMVLAPADTMVSRADDEITQAPWTEGPVSDGHPSLPNGVPFGEGRNFRVHLSIDVPQPLTGMRDLPVSHELDVARILGDEGYPTRSSGRLDPFRLNLDSFALVEVDPSDGLLPVRPDGEGGAQHEPLIVFPGSFTSTRSFDARTNPTVTLQWILQGPSEGERHYMVYFDTEHNGPKTPVNVPDAALGTVASAVGPGRGNQIFVPLHSDGEFPGEPRSIRVMNLQDGEVNVEVYCYERSRPRANPAATATLNGFGDLWDFDSDEGFTGENRCREGAALVQADGLVMAEATSTALSTTHQIGSSRLFIPSVDGGFTGTSFTAQSDTAMDWLAFCPAVLNPQPCMVEGRSIPPNAYSRFPMAGGATATLTASQGEVAVQRVPTSPAEASSARLSPSLWPPLDGPLSSGLFMGHALSEAQPERLFLMAHQGDTRIRVQSVEGAQQRLTDQFNIGGPGLYVDSAGNGWTTAWNRGWRMPDGELRNHLDGVSRIETIGNRGLSVTSGATPGGFSAFVPLQSPDGGLSYSFSLPERDAQPLGRLSLFSIHDGTDVVASGISPSGNSLCCEVRESLQAGQFVRDMVHEPGWWTIEATRPVVMAWVHVDANPLSAYAPGSSDLLEVREEGAHVAGYLLDLRAEEEFRSARPGSTVEFSVAVENLARSVTGEPLPDRVQLRARVPSGWSSPDVIPSTIDFGANDGPVQVRLEVRVPGNVDVSRGGATVTLEAQSANQPELQVTTSLGINYRVQRGVLVTANDQPSEASQEVVPGETATYNVRVTNTGSVADAFHLEHSLPSGEWEVEALCVDAAQEIVEEECLDEENGTGVTPMLDPQETSEYLFTITPGDSADDRFVTLFAATSGTDPSIRATVRMVSSLEIDRDLSFQVEETTRVVNPGDETTFHVVIRNEADSDEELNVTVSPQLPESWPSPTVEVLLANAAERTTLRALNNTVGIEQHSEVELWITQAVAEDAPPRVLGVDQLITESTLASGDRPTTIDLRVVVAEVRGFEVEIPENVRSAAPGQSIDLFVDYHSIGNGVQTLTVRPETFGGTGWAFQDADGQSPPWTLELPPRGTVTLDVTAQVPRDAPTLAGGLPLVLRSSVDGYPRLPATFLLSVAPEPRVNVETEALLLDPGRMNTLQATLANTGNVPLRLQASWQDFPAEIEVEDQEFTLEVGQTRTVSFNASVPPHASLVDEVRLSLTDPDAAFQDTTQWPVALGRPGLEPRLVGIRAMDTGAQVLELELSNPGSAAAYDILAEVRDGDRLVDAADLNVVRPGETRGLNLVVPPDVANPVTVIVFSADNPDGIRLEAVSLEPDEQGLPLPVAVLFVAVGGVIAALGAARRWRA